MSIYTKLVELKVPPLIAELLELEVSANPARVNPQSIEAGKLGLYLTGAFDWSDTELGGQFWIGVYLEFVALDEEFENEQLNNKQT